MGPSRDGVLIPSDDKEDEGGRESEQFVGLGGGKASKKYSNQRKMNYSVMIGSVEDEASHLFADFEVNYSVSKRTWHLKTRLFTWPMNTFVSWVMHQCALCIFTKSGPLSNQANIRCIAHAGYFDTLRRYKKTIKIWGKRPWSFPSTAYCCLFNTCLLWKTTRHRLVQSV